MTLNRPLLAKALQFVEQAARSQDRTGEAHKVWDQGDWSHLKREVLKPEEVEALSQPELLETCGTAYCVAGYVTSTLPEYRAEIDLENYVNFDGKRVVSATLLEYFDDVPISSDERQEFTHARLAQEALGLTPSQADALFDASNGLGDVRWLVEGFIAEEDRLEAQRADDYTSWQQKQ